MSTKLYREMQDFLMTHLRLMHYPIAIRYVFDQDELDRFKKEVPHYVPGKALTFCQAEIGARMEGMTVLVEKEKLGCANAKFVFGWKGLDEAEIKSHMKYVRDADQAEAFVRSKPRLPEGALLAAVVSPLADAFAPPHAAACGGNVQAYNTKAMNVFMACSGSYNAGKTERGEINVAIPGEQLPLVVERLKKRIDEKGGAAITRVGDPFPGADICKNCPLISFKKAGTPDEAATG